MKTTINLQADLYELVNTFGKKNMSKTINEALYEHLVLEKKQKSMFGADKRLQGMSRDDIRDHYEHDV